MYQGLGSRDRIVRRDGYGQIRRSGRPHGSTWLSMSSTIRCWAGSGPETPTQTVGTVADLPKAMTDADVHSLCQFLNLAKNAWGSDPEYAVLWRGLNLTLCMWLYRRTVITQYSPNTAKVSGTVFQKGLMALSASSPYVDWLVGRNLGEKDRSPCFARIRDLVALRFRDELKLKGKPRMPSPAWLANSGRSYANGAFTHTSQATAD